MKLVDILARELSEWPRDGVSCIVQEPDTKLYAKYRGDDDDNPYFKDGEWMSVWHEKQVSFLIMPLATDHATAIVTREMWEAERIQIGIDAANAGKTTPLAGIKAKYSLNPITKRDRIRAIDAQLADLTAERAERIAELAADGFALLPVVGAVEHAVDMSDWRNWQAGDLLEIESCKHGHDFHNGEIVIIESIKCKDPNEDCRFKCRGDRDFWFVGESECIFHSRPKPC